MKRLLMLGSGSYKSILSMRLLALAKYIKTDWNVTLITPSADKYNNFIPDKNPKVPGVRVVQPWQFTTKNAMLNLLPYLFTSLVAILWARPKVVYLYKPTPITVWGLVPRLFGATVILDLDDLGSEVIKAQGRSRFEYLLVRACESLALRFCSAVVVASTYLQTQVAAQYPRKKILLLPNGVEPGDYKPLAATTPRQAVYYFGAVDRLSLIEDLLRAVPAVVKKAPQATFTIIGGGSALDQAKQLVKELGIKKYVKFTGWVHVLAAQRYAQFADVAVCYQPDVITVRAASNMKVFQYMAMHTVPIVSNVGDLKTYIKNGRAGMAVSAGDTAALATAITALLKDGDRRARLANYGYQLAQSEYSWQRRAADLQTFITEVRS